MSQELQIIDLVEGDGKAAVKGALITTQYTGWLADGSEFDSSWSRGKPFQCVIGTGRVIKGWEQRFAMLASTHRHRRKAFAAMKAPATRRPKAISYVRFSSMRQTNGTSVERQQMMIDQWRLAHPEYDYDSELTYEDLASSGFKGEHIEEGGGFAMLLDAVRRGVIQAGDVVLVEAIDRTGRMEAMDMFSILSPIISAGVSIITLDDGVVYNRASMNSGALFILAAKIQQAYQYSAALSRRIEASYEFRKKAAKNGVMPKRWTPIWLTTSGEVKADIAAQVKIAFELYVSGLGKNAIAKRIRESGVPELAKTSGPTVDGWLQNPTAIGRWAPKPIRGEPQEVIEGVYPEIVSLSLYQKAQLHRERVATSAPVQHSKHFLVGLVKCSECGKNYVYQNVNGKPHNMKCRVHTNDKQCSNSACMPKPVMDAILAWTGDRAKLDGIATLHTGVNEVEIAALRAEIDGVSFKITGLTETIKAIGAVKEVLDDLKALSADRQSMQDRLTLLERTEKPAEGKYWQHQAEMWWMEENDPERLSALMQQVGYTITVHPDKTIRVSGVDMVYRYDGYSVGKKHYRIYQGERLVTVWKGSYGETGVIRREDDPLLEIIEGPEQHTPDF